ncbi:radical SAM protein [Kitasatospora sp. MAP5-34]|uniref:radical SAM protein n=1 Tax=Kitasatospora sp. MAP5-34 TaxID=3035102 RepID=UPI0024765D70|nr:radical SAM protein [Kitasatospora sp. MAP5-34]
MIELEITGECQLVCEHCFADSGPAGTHGVMTQADWFGVIDQATEIGIATVQLIGGEPTTFPGWAGLVDHALSRGRKVEIFSNLYHVSAKGWAVFEHPGVSLATSYYSVNAGEHDKVTKTIGSHERTRANIVEAIRRGIPIRAGIVGVHDGQLERLAVNELHSLGIERVTLDYARGVGRSTKSVPDVSALCGNCGRGRLAIMPDGSVSPCVLGRFLKPANVRESSLASILAGPEWAAVVATIPERAEPCGPNGGPCSPSDQGVCGPGYTMGGCPPNDSNDCSPANTEACGPSY